MSFPSEKRLQKWKEEFGWLRITETKKMICEICCSQEDKIRSMPNISFSFLNGRTNHRLSAIKDHDSSA